MVEVRCVARLAGTLTHSCLISSPVLDLWDAQPLFPDAEAPRVRTAEWLDWSGTGIPGIGTKFGPVFLAETEYTMIENRELTMDDYLAILRRRWKVLVIPGVL